MLGTRRGDWMTKSLGPESTRGRSGASSVPVTGKALATHTRKGLSPFPPHASSGRVGGIAFDANPAQLRGSEHYSVDTSVDNRGTSVDRPANFSGTRSLFAKGRARPLVEGIELLPRPPATGGGTARRRRSGRERTGLPGSDRGGEMTAAPGPEEKSGRSGASSVPVTRRALGTHTLEGPSPFWGESFRANST